jgi:hypothetical protein
MKATQRLGMTLLGVWLLLTGILPFLPGLAGVGTLLSLLAVAAGLVILLGR